MKAQTAGLLDEVSQLVTRRILWVLLPAQEALQSKGKNQLAEIVTWSLGNLEEDLRGILQRHNVNLE